MSAHGNRKKLCFSLFGSKKVFSYNLPVARLAILLSLFMAQIAWSADGAIVWERAQILDAEQVAKSGNLEVPMPLVRLAIPISFDDFRYPFLQDDGSVVFIANDKAGSGRHGIYRIATNGELRILAADNDEFSNAPFLVGGFSGLRVAGGRAVFRCGFGNYVEGGTGIGMWEDGALTLLARTGDAAGFEDLGYPGLSEQVVTFLAKRPGDVDELHAVDLLSFPRTPRKVADTLSPIPGHPGKFFGTFGFQQDADGESAVFRGFDVGARDLLQQTGGRASALGGVFRKNIRSEEPPQKIVDTATPLPGAPNSETFAELQNAIPRDGTMVVPSWSGEHSGIYYIGRDGRPLLVADTATRIPDLFEGSFTGFNKWAANCSPWVVFRGSAAQGFQGLFAMHMERNELFLLLDTQSQFDGKQISDFEFGCNPKLGENLVVAIEFQDGTSGIYLLKFGDGLGKAVFRPSAEISASTGLSIRENTARSDLKKEAEEFSTDSIAVDSAVVDKAELIEEGSFRMLGDVNSYSAPLAATGKANEFDGAVLLERGSVFPARKGLNFGYRYVLHNEGEDRCGVDGYETRVIHPPMVGRDGKSHTESIIPTTFCFKGGKAEDFVIYALEEDSEVLPGAWTLQLRKHGQVLLSRSFTLL
jgi:hypothetical protein